MDYVNTYPNTYVQYYTITMILNIDINAAYLAAPKARSRVAGYYYLLSIPNFTERPRLNGAIFVECKTLRHVICSAAEEETGVSFHNAQVTIPIRTLLQVLDHPQPTPPIKTDNSTANSFIHYNIHQKRSKSCDMRYY